VDDTPSLVLVGETDPELFDALRAVALRQRRLAEWEASPWKLERDRLRRCDEDSPLRVVLLSSTVALERLALARDLEALRQARLRCLRSRLERLRPRHFRRLYSAPLQLPLFDVLPPPPGGEPVAAEDLDELPEADPADVVDLDELPEADPADVVAWLEAA
jgi:hypothetical protein